MRQVFARVGKGRGAVTRLVVTVMLVAVLASIMGVGAFSKPVGAATFEGASGAKLTASDGATASLFGYSVAISGDTMVVGAAYSDVGANIDQGSAYVFVRSGGAWYQVDRLTASDGAGYDGFGYSVAISGDTIVVGSPFDTVGVDARRGSACVFMRSGGGWHQVNHLTAYTDGAAEDRFGTSVAISGDTVVVGATGRGNSGTMPGWAYVFLISETSWTQQAKLAAFDGAADDLFGYSVAISGERVVVGAPLADGYKGAAYQFMRTGTTWSTGARLPFSDGAVEDSFGSSVAISGSTVVVGAYGTDIGANVDQGSAYVFAPGPMGIWMQQAKLTASDGATGYLFGMSVAISGDMVIVGDQLAPVGANTAQGSAYVFVRSDTGWSQDAKLTASDGAVEDQFGNSVAISGDTAVVGAYGDNVGANTLQGSAYVYRAGEGAEAAQVAATVTLQLISVTIADGYPTAVDYGVMAPNREATPLSYNPDTHSNLRVRNNGSMVEDLLIKGANATCGTGTWALSGAIGPNAYCHLYGTGSMPPATYNHLSTDASILASAVGMAETVDFNLKMQTPTESTVWGQYSTMVAIVAMEPMP